MTVLSQYATRPQAIQAYADWAHSRWGQPANPADPALASQTVMALGLGGETGEVLEVLLQAQGCQAPPLGALAKEMGDAAYYWARVTTTFGLDPVAVYFEHTGAFPDKPGLFGLRMAVGSGLAQEALKKLVRDGHLDLPKLREGLVQFITAWRGLCAVYDFDDLAVLQANIAKVDSRHARGVLHGSGNDR